MKPIWLVLITVLVTGGLVGGGTYYYLNKKAEKENSDLTKQIDTLKSDQTALRSNIDELKTTIVENEKPASTDETADWLTYADTANKFSLKYPKDWIIENRSANGEIVALISPANKQKRDIGAMAGPYSYNVVVSFWKSINDEYAMAGTFEGQRTYKDLADFLTDNKGFKRKLNQITVDNTVAYYVNVIGNGSNLAVMMEKTNGIYEIGFPATDGKNEAKGDEALILSSFKFL